MVQDESFQDCEDSASMRSESVRMWSVIVLSEAPDLCRRRSAPANGQFGLRPPVRLPDSSRGLRHRYLKGADLAEYVLVRTSGRGSKQELSARPTGVSGVSG